MDLHSVRALRLDPIHFSPINIPRGLTFGVEVFASLTIVHPDGPSAALVLSDCPLLETDLSSARCDALIGRDVLARCVLTLDGPSGEFTLRYP